MSAWEIRPEGIVAVDHVQVAAPAGCERDARRFYGDLLGLEEIEKPPALAARGGCWFRAGAQELHVGVADTFTPATKAHPGLLVGSAGSLRGIADRLREAGVEVTWADEGEIQGRIRFHAADPWGNRVELLADA
jgi:catechol 2,3-dioxygenase-like lactoylglutathione lyase family enzyme